MSKNRLIKLTGQKIAGYQGPPPGTPTRGVPFPGFSPQSAYCVPVFGAQPVYEDTILHTVDPNTGLPIDVPHKVYKGFQNVLVGEQCFDEYEGLSWGVMGGVASATVAEQGGSVSQGGGGAVVVTPPPAPPGSPPPPPRIIPVPTPGGGGGIILVPGGGSNGAGGDAGSPDYGGTVGYGPGYPGYPRGLIAIRDTKAAKAGTHAQITITGPFLGYLWPGDQGLPLYETDYNIGFNAGAYSILALPHDCIYTFTVPDPLISVITGLNNGPRTTSTGVTEIGWGFMFFGSIGKFTVIEANVGRLGDQSYVPSDVFAIVRRGTSVSYWKNGLKFYQSTVPSSGSVFVDSTLMSGGDSIVDAHFTAIVPAEFSAQVENLHGILPGLVGAAGDNTVSVAGVLGPLVGTGFGDGDHVLNGVLPGLVGEIYAGNYSSVRGVIGPLVGYIAAQMPVVPFAIVNGVLTNLITIIRAKNGTLGRCEGILTGLTAFIADNDGAYCTGILLDGVNAGMEGVSTDQTYNLGNNGQLTFPRMVMHGHGSSPVIYGEDGEPRPGYGFYGKVPRMLLSGTGGGAGILRLPRMQLAATGTAITIAHLDALLPKLTLSITGVVTYVGRLDANLPKLKLIGYGGGGSVGVGPDGKVHGALTFPKLRFIEATGNATGAGVLNKRLPRLRFVDFTGTRTTTAGLVATLPMLRFVQAAMLIATLPRLYMRATGSSPGAENVSAALASEAYSFTLMPQDDGEIGTAATRITNYPFLRLVRYMDRYYGVAIDGIYLLEGDDFAGEPIVACVQTGSEDYDRPNLKRLEALWFSGRCGADMNVAAISAESEEPVYYMNPDKVGARAQRVEFGRGTEARYWAVRFTNIRGEDFQVENAASEITVLKRTHGGPS